MKKELNNIEQTGFKTPKDYFSSFEDRILQNIKLDTAVNTSKASGFKTPEDYFDSLEDVITSNISNKKSTKVVSLFTKRNLIYISGVAAAVLIIFSIFLNNPITIDNVDLELVENYIIEEDIDTYDIAALLTDEDLTEDVFTNSDYLNGSLEDYILENTMVEDLIIE